MRIFVVTNDTHILRPGGAQEDIYALCRRLTELGHESTIVALGAPKQTPEALDVARKLSGVPVEAILAPPESLVAWLRRCVAEPSFLDRQAYLMQRLVETPAYDRLVHERRPDLIIGVCSFTWPVMADAKHRGLRVLFRSHDFAPDFFMETIEPIERLFPANWVRFIGKHFTERRAVRWCDHVSSTPLREIALYERWRGASATTLTLAYLSDWVRLPVVHAGKRPIDVFYFGASYNINLHRRGVEALIEKIAPLALAKAPGAFRFNVTGAKLPERLKAKCDGKTIIYHDYVPDLQKFLDGMDVGIAPVDTGRSIKGKVFGPICRGFPMIISPLCVSLQPLVHDTNVLIADTPEEYAEALVRLLDENERRRIADGAAAYAQEYCSLETIQEALQSAIDAAMKS